MVVDGGDVVGYGSGYGGLDDDDNVRGGVEWILRMYDFYSMKHARAPVLLMAFACLYCCVCVHAA